MTVYFRGCECKYDIEALLKLFIPLENFSFVFGGEAPAGISRRQMIEIIKKPPRLLYNNRRGGF